LTHGRCCPSRQKERRSGWRRRYGSFGHRGNWAYKWSLFGPEALSVLFLYALQRNETADRPERPMADPLPRRPDQEPTTIAIRSTVPIFNYTLLDALTAAISVGASLELFVPPSVWRSPSAHSFRRHHIGDDLACRPGRARDRPAGRADSQLLPLVLARVERDLRGDLERAGTHEAASGGARLPRNPYRSCRARHGHADDSPKAQEVRRRSPHARRPPRNPDNIRALTPLFALAITSGRSVRAQVETAALRQRQ
jgi:hypothetical protein